MRSILALLGGVAISAIGLVVVLQSTWDLPGVALIVAGAAVASQRLGSAASLRPGMRGPSTGKDASLVRWPSGLAARLAHRAPPRDPGS